MDNSSYPLTNVIPTSLSFPNAHINYHQYQQQQPYISTVAEPHQNREISTSQRQYFETKSPQVPRTYSQYPIQQHQQQQWLSNNLPSCSTSIPKTPQSQHKYVRQSSYPFSGPQQFSAPIGPPLPQHLQTSIEWQNTYAGQYEQQQQQQNHYGENDGPVERPWYLWGIGAVDLLSAAWYTVMVTYNIVLKPISDPETYIWKFFLGFLAILARFLQGLGLLVGLKSDDVISTLWYCKFWVACQFLFICYSIISAANLYISYPKQSQELPLAIFSLFGVFIYRVGSFTIVRKFVAKIKKSESITLRNNIGSGKVCSCADQGQDDEDSRNAIGETSFCAPSVALILSL